MNFRLLNRRALYRGFFRLDAYTVELDRFDGRKMRLEREHLERGDAIAVLLHDPQKDQVLLIEQFRIGPAVRGDEPWLIEIVAGMIDAGEEPEAGARRECVEEAGYDPDELRLLGCYYATPGGSSERIYLYLGTVDADRPVSRGGGLDHEDEDIRVFWISRREALSWLDEGRINSGAPMLALALAFGGINDES